MKQALQNHLKLKGLRSGQLGLASMLFAGGFIALAISSNDTRAQEVDTLLRRSIDATEGLDEEVQQTFSNEDDTRLQPNRNENADTEIFSTPIDDFSNDPSTTPRPRDAAGSIGSNLDRSNTNRRATNVLRQNQVGELDDDGQLDPRGNRPVTPLDAGTTTPDTDPYGAVGIRLGSFDLFPTLEQSIGYTTNADFARNGTGSGFSETTAGLRLQSDWSLHAFQAELGATYQRFFSGDSDDLPTANASATLRLDVNSEYAITLGADYDFITENATSSNLNTGVAATIVERPGVHGLAASVEIAKTEGKLRFSLRGSLDNTIYEDADLSDGSVLQQGDRDNILASVTGRLSYQASPALAPFIEASAGRRIYDIKIDSNGNQRDSNVYALRGGVELDFAEKLTGQIAGGYTFEEFADPNINKLSAVTFDGSLNWSPVRLTNVTAFASTTLSPSANVDDNGSVIYFGTLGISRQVRPQLSLDANVTASLEDFDTSGRRDIILGVNAGYTYWFNRFIAATGRVSYQNVDSTDAASTYDVGTIRFGLKLQR